MPLVLFFFCCSEKPQQNPPKLKIIRNVAETSCTTAQTTSLQNFLMEHQEAYKKSISKAKSWLDQLHVNPLELRKYEIKGKKKFVELLDAYFRLWQMAHDSEKTELMKKITEIVAITATNPYHDMGIISDNEFKQDATSYLRAALLIDKLGFDTARYRREIQKIHSRLNAHMSQRGPHQKQAFHWYYQYFGLQEPFPLQEALRKGIIAVHKDPKKFTKYDAYTLTHEVFAPYEYGENLDVEPFSAQEKIYLQETLQWLTQQYIKKNNPDLVAELISCQRYLRFTNLTTYQEGLLFLLKSQNTNGSWGDYEKNREKLGSYVDQNFYLHTTAVAIDALTVSFYLPWNQNTLSGYCHNDMP